jgi:anion-transporting  ArsA/GET3 family ATPase
MGGTGDEHSMLDALEPTRQPDTGISDEERSILADINHIREHIETLEQAARVARAVEFEKIRAVVEQLEAVAAAAKEVERDLSQELATTNRLSVTTARLIRDQLAVTLRALADALVSQDRTAV